MRHTVGIAFFGSSLVSACWNGAAMYNSGINRTLYARSQCTAVYEPDAHECQVHRDIAAVMEEAR